MTRWIVAAVALAAIAAWPLASYRQSHLATADTIPAAPAPRDYLDRNKLIAFYEREAAKNSDDQVTLRMLAAQYLQRFRERGDLGDVARAQAASRRSLELQPYGNDAANMTMASALLAYHQFSGALRYERAAVAAVPTNDLASAQVASLLMELGHYDAAARTLAHPSSTLANPTWMSVQARYDELTGRLSLARNLIGEAATMVDREFAAPGYARSWYHMRAAQLAFESGDDDTVRLEIAESLRLFPDNAATLMVEAQWLRAQHRWREALAAATRSADLYPLPQALGYEADAQRALGDAQGAAATDALIDAEQRLYNTQGINDRLLAMYYAQRRTHLDVALRMASADLRRRGNEIYADDTMAWVLAALGRWHDARSYAQRATAYGTEDPMLEYHAGVIAMETGHNAEARRRLTTALRLNPQFDAFYAGDARRRCGILASS
jgi:predicted Zn-dependent protease